MPSLTVTRSVYGGMPRRRSAKLIFSTSTNGNAKNSVSHRNGTPITVVRPDGSSVERRFFSEPSNRPPDGAPSAAGEEVVGLLIASAPRR
ncbi:hypothetical protein R75471_07345 [Paraburkholderia domus]|nr:hypothetical protein R75483_07870 [Paraburkholderia domus]CAE6969275.1 hypothetical protein R75471_07345 [Paraburkholderia domus]CAE6970749.1 hypothetical protein R70199_08235 [Paraburkholderia domus]